MQPNQEKSAATRFFPQNIYSPTTKQLPGCNLIKTSFEGQLLLVLTGFVNFAFNYDQYVQNDFLALKMFRWLKPLLVTFLLPTPPPPHQKKKIPQQYFSFALLGESPIPLNVNSKTLNWQFAPKEKFFRALPKISITFVDLLFPIMLRCFI